MKAKDALKILGVTRATLCRYVKSGIIEVTKCGNGLYEYNDNSVYAFIGLKKVRNKFVSHLKKLIKNTNIEFIEVAAQYSSYVGNLVYRDERLPDECLSSIEIGRRGYEFSGQYLFKRLPKKKNIIVPNIEELKNQLAVSLEEIGIDVHSLDNWIRLCSEVKKSNKRYRFSLEDAIAMCTRSLFIKNYYNRYTSIYRFI